MDKKQLRKYIWAVLVVLICLAFLAELLVML
jgi:hypothetical protein